MPGTLWLVVSWYLVRWRIVDFFTPSSDLKAAQTNVQSSLIFELMLYMFKFSHNATKEKKNCHTKIEDEDNRRKVTRWYPVWFVTLGIIIRSSRFVPDVTKIFQLMIILEWQVDIKRGLIFYKQSLWERREPVFSILQPGENSSAYWVLLSRKR